MKKLNETTWKDAKRDENRKPIELTAFHEKCVVEASDTIEKKIQVKNPRTGKAVIRWVPYWIYSIQILGGEVLEKDGDFAKRVKPHFKIRPNDLTKILQENDLTDFNNNFRFRGQNITREDFDKLKDELDEIEFVQKKGKFKVREDKSNDNRKEKKKIASSNLSENKGSIEQTIELETIKEEPSGSCERVTAQVQIGKSSVTFTYQGSEITYGTIEYDGETWLDRNLGASQVATGVTDSNAYGDLFQWGRPDDGHQDRISSTTNTLATSDEPEHSNFITPGSSPYDWRNPQNDDMWQEDGIGSNDPDSFPTYQGYRAPTQTEWESALSNWSNGGDAYNDLKTTYAGFRESDGSLRNVDTWGYYWSSTVSGDHAGALFLLDGSPTFGYDAIFSGSGDRACGASMRLIYDESLDGVLTIRRNFSLNI